MKKMKNQGFAHLWVIIAVVVVLVAVLGVGYRIKQSSDKKVDSTQVSNASDDTKIKNPEQNQTTPSENKQNTTSTADSTTQHVDQTPYAAYHDAVKKSGQPDTFEYTGTPVIEQSQTSGYTTATLVINGPGRAYFYSTDGGKTWIYFSYTSGAWECAEFDTAGARAAFKGKQCWDSKHSVQSTVQ